MCFASLPMFIVIVQTTTSHLSGHSLPVLDRSFLSNIGSLSQATEPLAMASLKT